MGLTLENVCYQYKNAAKGALNGATCRFEAGACYAVVGPSGSGKTTLLSILAGLDAPRSGAVHLDGKSLAELDMDRYRRESVSIIFQAFCLFPLMTAMENVRYPMELRGYPKYAAVRRAEKLLVSVGIGADKHRRYPAHLSGGEQQRVAIARALSTGAKILLADESTGNLDGENGAKIIDILTGLAHGGRCVIIVTHDHDVAKRADKVFRMSDGVLSETAL